MPAPRDLRGMKFGSLTAIFCVGGIAGDGRYWLCGCDCETMKEVRASRLTGGSIKSCGCSKTVAGGRRIDHGFNRRGFRRTEYTVWAGMLDRCRRSTAERYPRYGGRGITVCARWNSFENFLADMGPRPAGMSIDRIDNDGNYEPGNCRWATSLEQAANTGRNVMLTKDGITKHVEEWGRVTGVGGQAIQKRLARGWSVYRALTEPSHAR